MNPKKKKFIIALIGLIGAILVAIAAQLDGDPKTTADTGAVIEKAVDTKDAYVDMASESQAADAVTATDPEPVGGKIGPPAAPVEDDKPEPELIE